jgi:predicted Zn-dependent protease
VSDARVRLATLAAAVLMAIAAPAAGQTPPPEGETPPPEASLTHELEDVALLFAQRGEHDQAIAIYDELRAARPENDQLLLALAASCGRSARCAPRREALLHEAMARFPDHAELVDDLVALSLAAGRHGDAVAALRRFLATHPDHPHGGALIEDLYTLLLQDGRFRLALAGLEAYVARRPEDPRAAALFVDAPDEIYRALLAAGRPATARRELRRFVDRHPDHATALPLLVDVLQERGDLADALAEVTRLVDRDPTHLATRLVELDLLEQLARPAALDARLAALATDFPMRPEVWVLVGERALELGDLAAAGRAAAAARARRPAESETQARLAALERDLEREVGAIYDEFRHEVRWEDLEDDLGHARYP